MNTRIIFTIIFLSVCTTIVSCAPFRHVYGQAGSTFPVSLGVTGPADAVPPSQPINLIATPVSSNQINLSWDASSDNVSVAGYVIYRDSTPIATTTVPSYIDSSLAASTTYAYYIIAFDPTENLSIPSATVSATTFALIVPSPGTSTPPATGGQSFGQSGSNILAINNLTIVPGMTSATVSFTNPTYTLAKIYWGATPDFEIGSMSGIEYSISHGFKIDALTPNTFYYLNIEVYDGVGRTNHMLVSFRTLPLPQESEVANPHFFVGTYTNGVVQLSWSSPLTSAGVIIMRSDKFFPVSLSDGKNIYEGTGHSFADADVQSGITYYYTLFNKDASGKFSSGAVTSVTVNSEAQNPFESLPFIVSDNPKIQALTFADIDFIQDGITLPNKHDVISIDASRDLTVSVARDKLPDVLKTIAVVMHDPKDSRFTFSFLLRADEDTNTYRAVIAPLERAEAFPTSVIIIDYKNRGIKKMQGTIVSSMVQSGEVKVARSPFIWLVVLAVLLILLPLQWLLVVVLNKSKKEND